LNWKQFSKNRDPEPQSDPNDPVTPSPGSNADFHYRMTFEAYIWHFCAQIAFDLVTLTCDPLTLAVSDELSFIHPTHMLIFSILRLSVPELWVTQSDYITITRTVTAHAPCHVTYHLGEMIHIFEITAPICLFTLSLSGRYDEDLAM